MARRYRAYGQGQWVASSGNAAFAVYNPIGSNKAIYLHSVEAVNVTRGAAATATSYARFAVARGVTNGGTEIPAASFDTNDTNVSTIKIYQNAVWTSIDQVIPWIQYKKWSAAAAPAIASQFGPAGKLNRTNFLNVLDPPRNSDLEAITLRPGESAGLCVTAQNSSQVYKANLRYKVVGGPTRSATSYIRAIADSAGPLVLRNDSASDVVRLLSIDVTEIGTLDSPYLQLCQVLLDPVSLADTTKQFSIVKFDTADAAFPGVVIGDAVVSPANGIPAVYMSDASAGSPKGFNYLGTKDFVGPAYFALFPETAGSGAGPGTLGSRNLQGLSNRKSNIFAGVVTDPIVLRPGEVIGLASAAELATGTTAVPVSGWSTFDFALTMSVQDLVVPEILLTGLQTGTRVAVLAAGTETLITIGDESGGEFSYLYASNPGTFVDLAILCEGFVYQRIDDVELIAAVQTFPVDQVVDNIYDNMLTATVTFDGTTKRIVCDTGTVEISVPAVYTEWVDWAMLSNNLRFFHAFENQGGTVIDSGAGTSIPAYCYLFNTWRVRPQEANHTLTVTEGILLVDGGGDPFVNTIGSFTVRILYQQPVQAITVSTGGGGGATAAQVWSYSSRALTDKADFTLATDAVNAATLAASAVAEIQSGLAVPGDAMTLAANAVNAAALATDAVTEIQAGLATSTQVDALEGDTAAIKAKTDQLAFTVANQVDANVQSMNDAAVQGTGTAGDLWRG